MTMLDLDVRDRLPERADRALDVAEVVVGVVLNVALYLLGAATTFGYATGELSLSAATWISVGFVGIMTVFYVAGRIRGDDEQEAAALVTGGEFLVYGAVGVGIALLPSPASEVLWWAGVVLAGLFYVRYEWVTARLGFEGTGEEVAA
ncbi:hypothetical protein [Halorussus sp. MSC15.2]|uniref:hypothetical protein n=1 Tax=Halorussus sp. MSC15.2 TaxID=2283638 RepID=UPI0013D8B810|nr:hypothetical protein [Halorussus sp. MSC15.2]NEU56753.1 hypothetical protein [Halorussus sp. MSC15.2]